MKPQKKPRKGASKPAPEMPNPSAPRRSQKPAAAQPAADAKAAAAPKARRTTTKNLSSSQPGGNEPTTPAQPSSPPAASRAAAKPAPSSVSGSQFSPPPSPSSSAVQSKRTQAVPRKTSVPKPDQPKGKSLKIPPILLEGDRPPAPKVTGPGVRYALTPGALTPPAAGPAPRPELPEAYGTRRLFLAARDPRWLYASWDLTGEQQRDYNQQSRDGHLVLRIFANNETGPAVPELHVNPESRNWFINVPCPETRYHAELGFYDRRGFWNSISTSQPTFTPPDAPAKEAAVEFATIPVQVTFQQVVETVQEFVTEHKPLLEAVIEAQAHQVLQEEATPAQSQPAPAQLTRLPAASSVAPTEPSRPHRKEKRATIPRDLPRPVEIPIQIRKGRDWTPQQTQALADLIRIDSYRRVWMGSIEITELVRRHLEEEVGSIAAAELARAAAEGRAGIPEFGISSPAESAPSRERKFWFKVNAELIIYGSTEPDAQVSIGGRLVKLRPDGTFSFRFALPDGRYDLPAMARSADGMEGREAVLEFSRRTEYQGIVEVHPQDASLKTPRAENI